MSDSGIYFYSGGAVKALAHRPRGWFGGLGIIFTSEDSPDLQGEHFTPRTEYSLRPGDTVRVHYRHGMDKLVKRKELTRANFEMRPEGIWFEGRLDLQNSLHQRIFNLLEKGLLGFSSGTMGYMAESVQRNKSREIVNWPVSEVSFTPSPVEGRTLGKISLKDAFMDTIGAEIDELDEWEREQEQLAEQYLASYPGPGKTLCTKEAEVRAKQIYAELMNIRVNEIYRETLRRGEELERDFSYLTKR